MVLATPGLIAGRVGKYGRARRMVHTTKWDWRVQLSDHWFHYSLHNHSRCEHGEAHRNLQLLRLQHPALPVLPTCTPPPEPRIHKLFSSESRNHVIDTRIPPQGFPNVHRLQTPTSLTETAVVMIELRSTAPLPGIDRRPRDAQFCKRVHKRGYLCPTPASLVRPQQSSLTGDSNSNRKRAGDRGNISRPLLISTFPMHHTLPPWPIQYSLALHSVEFSTH